MEIWYSDTMCDKYFTMNFPEMLKLRAHSSKTCTKNSDNVIFVFLKNASPHLRKNSAMSLIRRKKRKSEVNTGSLSFVAASEVSED